MNIKSGVSDTPRQKTAVKKKSLDSKLSVKTRFQAKTRPSFSTVKKNKTYVQHVLNSKRALPESNFELRIFDSESIFSGFSAITANHGVCLILNVENRET